MVELLTGGIAYNIFTHFALKYSRIHPLPLKRAVFLPRKWQRMKLLFFFSALNCGENIIKFVLLSQVLPTMWKIAFAASINPTIVILVDCTELFRNSSSLIIVWEQKGHHSYRILEPPKKTRSLTRYFAATSGLRILECLEWPRTTLTAGKRKRLSCLTRKRFDDSHRRCWCSVTVCVIAIFVNSDLNFQEE